MRYVKALATGVLLAGVSGAVAQSEWKIGVGAQTSAANLEEYHMGVGGSGSIAMERQFGAGTDSRIGVRGNYLNYEPMDEGPLDNFQQYGVGLEALIGPAGRFFEPKVGGHVGYLRVDGGAAEEDALDVGADVMATYHITPAVEMQALVTPTWLIDDEDTDYQTRGSLSIQLSLPGA